MIDNQHLKRLSQLNSSEIPKLINEIANKAKTGDRSAQIAISVLQIEGKYIEKSAGTAIKRLDSLTRENNCPDSAEALGHIYKNGLYDVVENNNLAEEYFRIAANNNKPVSAFELAMMYQSGEFFTKDMGEAIRWHEISARNGNVKSMECLGEAYLKGSDSLFGEYIKPNKEQAKALLENAIDLNSKKAAKLMVEYHLAELIKFTKKSDENDETVQLIREAVEKVEWVVM